MKGLFKTLRILIYSWLSIALVILTIGFLFIMLFGGIRNSDFPPLFVLLPLIASVLINILMIEKIRRFKKSDVTTQFNISVIVIIMSILEAGLAGYTFYLQTFGAELIILISISTFIAACNVIYLYLGKRISSGS